jgi:uncharacterized secreted protein with C-terminal beta-propeller domain
MVQKQITRKTPIYGVVGILTAIILVAMIYSYSAPALTPSPSPMLNTTPNPSPSSTSSPNPSDLTAALPTPSQNVTPIHNFMSYTELQTFLENNSNINTYWLRSVDQTLGEGVPMPAPAPTSTPVATSALSQESGKGLDGSYSQTNIQVAGVDEADTVKTDGNYIYLIANNTVYIINAAAVDPSQATVAAKIFGDDKSSSYLSGIYLSEDGSKLAVLGNKYMPYPEVDNEDTFIATSYWSGSTTFAYVYDVSKPSNPILARNFTMSGNYFNSRMIGDYVYVIINENVYLEKEDTFNVPIVFRGTQASNVAATNILYVPSPYNVNTYTTVVAINIMDDAKTPTETTVIMDGSSQMYVSADNIYITTPNYSSSGDTTSIYRINIQEDAVTAQAQGAVFGSPINQYAMDEYNGYFRIATTTWIQDNATTSDGVVFKVSRQVNSIYVLDMDMQVVGKLERFKMDENLYSVRFVGDKCYVVTFKQIDPFFIIDMSNPAAPRVAGELEIPGYSTFLYPMDENHVIGLGKENSTLKLSLFDVSNVNAPIEVAKYIVDAKYSDSTALYEPHAFLYDPQRQMLVIPVSVNDMPIIMPLRPTGDEETTTGKIDYWQGAYIFSVDTSSGFTLQGAITQMDDLGALAADPTLPIKSGYAWRDYNHMINRALYIDDVLYTFSQSRVQLNSLNDFALLAKIDLC